LLQTHWAENMPDCLDQGAVFPERRDYLDVYDHFGPAVGDHSVLAHASTYSDENRHVLAQTGTRMLPARPPITFLAAPVDCAALRCGVQGRLASDVGRGQPSLSHAGDQLAEA